MELENIPCPLCSHDESVMLFRSGDFRFKAGDETFAVVKCRNCGFTFLNPRPAKNEIAKFYPADFNKIDRSFSYGLLKPCFWLAQEYTIKLFRKYKKEGKSLDIGCGNGEFALAMQRHGFDAWGIEANSEAEKFTDSRLKGRILYKDIKGCGFAPKSFDIISMFQSLEHIHDLGGLFTEIKRVLKDDGLLYICVPNSDFFEARLFGPYYYNLEVPRHLYFFTKKSIKNLMLKNGFLIERFFRNSILESVSTPASLYHGLWRFLNDKKFLTNDIIKSLTFVPLVIVRLFLRLFFIFDDQNLKILCSCIGN